ncbi:MAG TPA: PspC domain-containing protein [Allosphingosinicella sp.]|nr:PspC domain-containing protein [Allosphingosinicella sp.]
MSERQPNLLTRDDTFFGVCQALGEDFGFPPNLLRIAFGIPVIFFPVPVLSLYFGLGAIVLLSRLIAPRPRRKAAQPAAAETPIVAQVPLAEADADQFALPMAA